MQIEDVRGLEFLEPEFLQAVADIGWYGHQKYGKDSFQHRRKLGDRSRGGLERTGTGQILRHATEHMEAYAAGEKHDHFGTMAHQLAAAAFNLMMEFYFANLGQCPGRIRSTGETLRKGEAGTSDKITAADVPEDLRARWNTLQAWQEASSAVQKMASPSLKLIRDGIADIERITTLERQLREARQEQANAR
jgi:hypothetical protein